MEPFSSLVELLAMRAQSQPDERAYIFLSDRGTEEAALSFRQLHDAANALAARLARCRPSRRARAAGVSARPRIHRRLFRMPDRRRHRGSHDDAAPAKRARFQCGDHRQLRTGGRADQCGICEPWGLAGALSARGAAMAGGRPHRRRGRKRRGAAAAGRTTSPSCNTPRALPPSPRASPSATPICSPIWR